MELLLANHAETTLNGGIAAGALALAIQAADTAKFPAPGANQYFKCHLVSKNTGVKEIIHVTAVVGANWTIVRAQEGTVALAFLTGDIVAMRPTRDMLALLMSSAKQNFTPVVAANDLVLSPGLSTVTGNTQINRLDNTNFVGGQIVRIVTTGTPTIKNNQATAGVHCKILTKSGADVVMAADKTFQAVYDESATIFREI